MFVPAVTVSAKQWKVLQQSICCRLQRLSFREPVTMVVLTLPTLESFFSLHTGFFHIDVFATRLQHQVQPTTTS